MTPPDSLGGSDPQRLSHDLSAQGSQHRDAQEGPCAQKPVRAGAGQGMGEWESPGEGPYCWLLGASERATPFQFPTKAAQGPA